ncbi:hypothetical protein SAMN05661086_02242 [Anaeromicropila populeti]|uniref:Transposase IS4-like domain-containing protein n=1 Tax=Anaeromicropila populeti TaxID=37658 RepID=A0A1I6K710_9FIRM|nr:hypothetical protein SAMN05661086_02242 [Anaeromicropila populeti]
MINPEQFHAALLEWVKAVRRSRDTAKGKSAIHKVSAWAVENRMVLGQYKVDEKSNEITAIPELLKREKKELKEERRYYREIDKEQGRLEIRDYYVETESDWMEQKSDWKNLQGIGLCHATVEKEGKCTESWSYAIFGWKEMTAEEFGKAKRRHWRIENSLHWILDIAYREDESRARNENSADSQE